MDLIDIKALAENHQTTPQVVGAKLGQLKNNPKIYLRLLRAGYESAAVPAWVPRSKDELARR